jgi:ABC-type branched-subunit amino acid transport system permease subunit
VSELLTYAIPGLPYGCVFALVGVSLLLTYKTSGMFNLAFGAQAYVSAVVFYATVEYHKWPLGLAFVVSVLVVGPAIGIIMDRLFRRYMQTSTGTVKLVTAIGLAIGIPSIVDFAFGTQEKLNPPSIAPDANHVFRFGSYFIDGNSLFIVIVTVALVVGLGLMFRFTTFGLRMRAVVESPRLVELAGISSDRVSMLAWILSSTVVALAGVMLAPLFGTVDVNDFNLVLVASIAAVAIGGMSSVPLTLVGGLVLGVGQQILAGYLPLNSILAEGLRPSFPFLVLVAALLLSPAIRRGREQVDPLAGCDPPPPPLAASLRVASFDRISKIGFPIFVAAVFYISLFVLSPHYLGLMTDVLIYSIIFLSVTVVTGLSGQISLCQMTFAGFGAFTAAQLATNHGMPFLLAMLIGGVAAAACGFLVALPALRLAGLYLALATLAFAIMADEFLFPLKNIGGGEAGVPVPRPVVGPIDFSNDKSFFVLCFIILVIVSFAVILIRRGTTGTFLAAMRGSEVAAASIGISLTRAKITVFTLSAGIAGIGGALLTSRVQHADGQTFVYQYSLVFVVLVLTTGARTVEGAINAAVAYVAVPEILSHLGKLSALEFALFGFGTLQYIKHPYGVLEYQKGKWMVRVNRLFERLHGGGTPGGRPGGPALAGGQAPSDGPASPDLGAPSGVARRGKLGP